MPGSNWSHKPEVSMRPRMRPAARGPHAPAVGAMGWSEAGLMVLTEAKALCMRPVLPSSCNLSVAELSGPARSPHLQSETPNPSVFAGQRARMPAASRPPFRQGASAALPPAPAISPADAAHQPACLLYTSMPAPAPGSQPPLGTVLSAIVLNASFPQDSRACQSPRPSPPPDPPASSAPRPPGCPWESHLPATTSSPP